MKNHADEPHFVLCQIKLTRYCDIMQFDIFPDQALLRREDPSQNMRRFYRMVVQRDLFGGASLIREWGRIGSPGKVRIDHHPDEGMAVTALMALATEKRRRGYAL